MVGGGGDGGILRCWFSLMFVVCFEGGVVASLFVALCFGFVCVGLLLVLISDQYPFLWGFLFVCLRTYKTEHYKAPRPSYLSNEDIEQIGEPVWPSGKALGSVRSA